MVLTALRGAAGTLDRFGKKRPVIIRIVWKLASYQKSTSSRSMCLPESKKGYRLPSAQSPDFSKQRGHRYPLLVALSANSTVDNAAEQERKIDRFRPTFLGD
jgi:hypothetical protein